jgi:hypothetical protein
MLFFLPLSDQALLGPRPSCVGKNTYFYQLIDTKALHKRGFCIFILFQLKRLIDKLKSFQSSTNLTASRIRDNANSSISLICLIKRWSEIDRI